MKKIQYDEQKKGWCGVSDGRQSATGNITGTITRGGAKRLTLLQKAIASPAKGTITRKGAKRLTL
jgi:hypothetical protein